MLVYYFAYGSNMDWGQMKRRCPSATFVAVAELPGHRLAFTRRSSRRRCGVADAVEEPDSSVWGVVYELDEADLRQLDECEGYQEGRAENSYIRRQCTVFLNGDRSQPRTAEIYFAVREPNPTRPNQQYKDLIVGGAKHWGLPQDYIENVLERIEVEPS